MLLCLPHAHVAGSLLGIFGVAAALNGFLYRPIPALLRVAMAVGGLGMMIPGTATDIAGFVLVVGMNRSGCALNSTEA